MKPTDLRGILQYIPRFRDRVFIIAMDGAIIADDNFGNLLLDIAVLRSLNIRLVLVHGAAHQLGELAGKLGVEVSNHDGTDVTDDETLRVATMAATQVTHRILEGLTMNDLRAAHTNCIEAVPLGILGGVDHHRTGKVRRVDARMLASLLEQGTIPVIPPLGFDGKGNTYRLNSDAVAVAVARELGAIKLMFLTTPNGLEIDGQLVAQIAVADLARALAGGSERVAPSSRSKARHALDACQGGVSRVHVISGQVDEGLLTEVFSNEGIGTLVYANEYQEIRSAKRRDLASIMSLIQSSVQEEQLVKRTRRHLEQGLRNYHVFETDGNIVGVCAIEMDEKQPIAELACLHVSGAHEDRGIGRRLAAFAEQIAAQRGARSMFCLSTQAFTYFQQKLGYREGTLQDLPPGRRERYERSGRNSKILVKNLGS